MKQMVLALAAMAALGGCSDSGGGEGAEVVNLYSARHYDSDQALYDRFTEETGITINLMEGNADELDTRKNSSR